MSIIGLNLMITVNYFPQSNKYEQNIIDKIIFFLDYMLQYNTVVKKNNE